MRCNGVRDFRNTYAGRLIRSNQRETKSLAIYHHDIKNSVIEFCVTSSEPPTWRELPSRLFLVRSSLAIGLRDAALPLLIHVLLEPHMQMPLPVCLSQLTPRL